jgi:hypothetical protein
MKLKQVIRNRDMFGHRVELNFNNQGSSHKTLCGGIGSIMLQTLMMVFVNLNVKKLFLQEDDNLKSITKDQDLEEQGSILLNLTNFDAMIRITNGDSM